MDKFFEDGTLPKSISDLVEPDPNSSKLLSREFKGVAIGDIAELMSAYYMYEETE